MLATVARPSRMMGTLSLKLSFRAANLPVSSAQREGMQVEPPECASVKRIPDLDMDINDFNGGHETVRAPFQLRRHPPTPGATEDAPALIERLLRLPGQLKILVLTVHENIHYAVRVLDAGAHGYLIKSAAVDELVEAIDTVRQGRTFVSPRLSQDVLQHLRRPKRERVGLDALSQREFDLLRMLGAGKSLQECAAQMKVRTSTASTYRTRIMEKLNLTSTAELTALPSITASLAEQLLRRRLNAHSAKNRPCVGGDKYGRDL